MDLFISVSVLVKFETPCILLEYVEIK